MSSQAEVPIDAEHIDKAHREEEVAEDNGPDTPRATTQELDPPELEGISERAKEKQKQKQKQREIVLSGRDGFGPVWEGLLEWRDKSAKGDDIRMLLLACSTTPEECHADTWPHTLTIELTRGVPIHVLQDWLSRNSATLCSLSPALVDQDEDSGVGVDAAMNPVNYTMFCRLLMEQNLFATVSWVTPFGVESKTILLFSITGTALVGAVFPYGMPELPVAIESLMPSESRSLADSLLAQLLPPDVVQCLQNLTHEKRNMVILALIRLQKEEVCFSVRM